MLGAAWFIVIRLLSPQWTVYEQYQYGWAVPFLCLYLLFLRWQDRPGEEGGGGESRELRVESGGIVAARGAAHARPGEGESGKVGNGEEGRATGEEVSELSASSPLPSPPRDVEVREWAARKGLSALPGVERRSQESEGRKVESGESGVGSSGIVAARGGAHARPGEEGKWEGGKVGEEVRELSASSPLPSPPRDVEVRELTARKGPLRRRDSAARLTRPALPLLCLVVVGLLWLPTRIIVEANLIWRAASWAMAGQLVLITLAILLLAGGRAWMKHFGFAAAFFLVAVPWPSQWENALVQGLMRWNTAIVVEMISLLGIPALQHGNVIEVSTGMVGVDEACSGIRSLQATFMIALFFGEYYRLRPGRRVGLVAAGAGLAMGCNIARTFTLVYVSSRAGLEAMERWHDPTGVAILLACFCGLWWIATRMKQPRMSTDEHGTMGNQPVGKIKAAELNVTEGETARTGLRALPGEEGKGERGKGGEFKVESRKQKAENTKDGNRERRESGRGKVPRGVVVGLAIWLGLVEVVNALWFGLRDQQRTDVQNWTVHWPTEKAGFRKVEFSARVLAELRSQRHESVGWREDDGSLWQVFHLGWGPATNKAQRVKVLLAKGHRPEVCLPAAGSELVEQRGIKEFTVGGLALPFRAFEFADQKRPLVVYFCSWEDGDPGTPAELRENNASRLRAAWIGHRSVGQRVLELAIWGKKTADEADEAMVKVLGEMVSVSAQ